MAITPPPRLPEAVEKLVALCSDKSQQPADAVARRHLFEVGESESLRILSTIHNTSARIRNLSNYIVYLVKEKNKTNSSLPSSPISHNNSPQGPSVVKRKRESDCLGEPSSVAEEEPVVPLNKREIVLNALGKLQFRKTFLILNYIGLNYVGSSVLEEALRLLTVDQIQSYDCLCMREFENEIWNRFVRSNSQLCQEKERVKKMNWETVERYNYHCHVDTEANCRFKGPFWHKAATLLQKTVKDENVLIVKFIGKEANRNTSSILQTTVFNKVFDEGIFVGKKCYRFFVSKDGGREEKKKDPSSSPVKCYFVCMEGFADILGKPSSDLKDMPVSKARQIFMHINKATSLSNYMSRFSLVLSKTITMELNYDDVHVEVVDDEPCLDEYGEIVRDKDKKALILTDGTGFISEDLALKCPQNCSNGVSSEENVEDLEKSLEALQVRGLSEWKTLPTVPPLLIQFRMFHKGRAIKGTVLVNRKLPPNTIIVRNSMLKIDCDGDDSGGPVVNSFEVVATSNKPNVASLSKNLIALLHFGGVPKHVFMDMLWNALKKPFAPLYKIKAAIQVAVNWDFSDEFIATRMVASGIPLDEPFLRQRLSEIAKEEMKGLKGGKLPVSDSYYVMGTADPTHTLNCGEVCIILGQGQLSGPVLVYRNPGLHPGDVHVVNARYVEALGDFVGNSKYGIFFPSKGPRSMGDEFAGGDYDGDMYWISTNAELLKYFRPSEPWTCSTTSKSIIKKDVLPSDKEALERQLFRLYLSASFSPSKAMGIAADSWLMYMDRMLTLGDDHANEKANVRKKIDELIDIYYDALDAPKKGRKIEVPKRLVPEKYPHHMGKGEHCTYKSKSILGEIHDTVEQLIAPVKFWKLKCFEDDIPEKFRKKWERHYDNYRSDMKRALDESRNAALVYQTYRKELYGGVDELDLSEKAWKDIRLEALMIYHVCYDYAEGVGDPKKCGFAWKVAGDALWKILLQSSGEKPILFAPSVVSQMMR